MDSKIYLWCHERNCDRVTDHVRVKVKGKPKLRCRHCGHERDERLNAKQPNPFGPKGRGF